MGNAAASILEPHSPELAGCCQKNCSNAPNLSDKQVQDILLVQSVMRGDLADVKRALRGGADPNTTTGIALKIEGTASTKNEARQSPVMTACSVGEEDVVLALLEHKACLETLDSRGWTPLCFALGSGHTAMARSLFAKLELEGNTVRDTWHARVLAEKKAEVLTQVADEVQDPRVAAAVGKFVDEMTVRAATDSPAPCERPDEQGGGQQPDSSATTRGATATAGAAAPGARATDPFASAASVVVASADAAEPLISLPSAEAASADEPLFPATSAAVADATAAEPLIGLASSSAAGAAEPLLPVASAAPSEDLLPAQPSEDLLAEPSAGEKGLLDASDEAARAANVAG